MNDIEISNLKQLLTTWKLENVLPHLIEQEIDVPTLKIMKLPHITSLLCDFPLGIQIRFEDKLEQWRQQIGKPLKYNAYAKTNEGILEQTMQFEGPNMNKSHNNNTNINSVSGVNLEEILMQSRPEGLKLLDIYHKNQALSNIERNLLIDFIVNYYLKHNLLFDLNVSYDLENAILSLFPSEKLLDICEITKHDNIYTKYLTARAVYNIKDLNNTKEEFISEDDSKSENVDRNVNSSLSTGVPTEILLRTIYNDCKKFVKIFDPFLYQHFLSAACSLFNIVNRGNLRVAVNECEISADDFKNVILQFYKLPSFSVELKEKEKLFNPNEKNNTGVQKNLPDANDIRNIPSLLPIVKMSDDGRPLENKHRTAIAKAIIDECLNFQPERELKRQDFFTLADNLTQAFPNEIASAYFIPSQPNHAARGKLWSAYNNKRSFLSNSGVVQRRQRNKIKRKLQSDEDDEGSEKTNDKIYVTDKLIESKEFSINTTLDWDSLQRKWSDCHRERRNELLKYKMSPKCYMQKYSILKYNRGIDLMEIDVNILHPTVVSINNWFSLHEKVIEMGRRMIKSGQISKTLENIDRSDNERYRASLALFILPYIFPYNARRNEFNEKPTKCDIQKRFIKEYVTMDDLTSDIDCDDLQIRFVHSNQKINYAEFRICGYLFKYVDLLEALNSIFHYSVALNMDYPKICLHIWQFIQLAIFQIELQDCKHPNVESTINDLYMT